MKLAIVHDYLNQYGGAERVIETLHELYPDAPIYASIYTPDTMPASFKEMDIRTSFMQKLPFLEKFFKYYLPLYPRAMESLNLSGYDVILSSSSAFAKGVRTEKGALHICYCYTPARFIWDYENYVKKEKLSKPVSVLLQLAIKRLRKWDLETISGVDCFIAISNNIRDKIRKFYNRDSDVIYPPVETSMFDIQKGAGDYFLIVSRLNSYKNLDLAVRAFNVVDLKLKIVGVGPFKKTLEKLAEGSNIEFLGKVTDEELIKLYGRCRALIFPGEEDFGITPLEAQASGRPVIAYARGGSLETIIDGKTGVLFKESNPGSIAEAIEQFIEIEDSFDKKIIRDNALRFSAEIFKEKIKTFIDKKYGEHTNKKI
ncbi:MAG: glycosyltransferase [Actinomycetia bacterium]|nr:glycosyltransferase [Actinomycetes bacterium]